MKLNKKILRSCLSEAIRRLSADSRTNEISISHYNHFSYLINNDNEVVEWGRNRQAPIPLYWGYDNNYQGLHSEMAAYKKASGLLGNKEFIMVNIRLSNRLHMLNSMPCKHCQRILRELGCDQIWFTTENGFEKMKL